MKEHASITGPSADFPFESRFVTVDGYKIHYVEEGRGDPVLFIHGNPTSSYIWRNILPRVAQETGRRGIAPDLLGFGKSDKPDVDYSLLLHERIVEGFIEQLRLTNIIMVLQDWGGPLGAAYAVRRPDNVRGITLMETFLWDTNWRDFGGFKVVFRLFRSPVGYLMLQVFNMFVEQLLPNQVVNKEHMTAEVMRRYREPFPTVKSRAAVRRFPQLILIEGEPKESREFIGEIERNLGGLKFPVQWIKATPGAIITKDTEYHLAELKEKLPQLVIKDFGPGLHYLQEDDPAKIAGLLVNWIRENELAAAA